MKYIILFFIALLSNSLIAQTVIQMQKEGGIYTMPCKVNDLKLRFIFDTGASEISISITEAIFMLKNGYLNESDITGTTKYSIANGDIEEGTTILLKEVIIGNLKLHNIEASIVHNLNAPLLLGQSALNKLGKIEFDYSNNTLTINNGNSTDFYYEKSNSQQIETVQRLYYSTFKKLPKPEQYKIIKGSEFAFYEYKKYRRNRTAGITILGIGVGTMATGIVFDLVQNTDKKLEAMDDYNDTGGNIAAIGAGVSAIGVGLWALAPKRLKNAIYYYNKDKDVALKIFPKVNGICIALNF